MKKLTCLLFLASGFAVAAEWNYLKPGYDPTGQVHLVGLSGAVGFVSAAGQKGVQSSASPTVLSTVVRQGFDVEKFQEFTLDSSSLISSNVAAGIYTYADVVLALQSEFDPSRSVVEVDTLREGVIHGNGRTHYTAGGPYDVYDQALSYGFYFNSRFSFVGHAGNTFNTNLMFSQAVLHPQYKVRVVQFYNATVNHFSFQFSTSKQQLSVDVPADSRIYYSYRNGLVSTCSYEYLCSISVVANKSLLEDGVLSITFSAHVPGQQAAIRVNDTPPTLYYSIVSPPRKSRPAARFGSGVEGGMVC